MASSSRLQLLTGRAGTGKTTIVLSLFRDRILKSGRAGLDQPSFFVLPSKEHGERIRGLLLRDRRFKGVLNFHVLTINDFIRLKTARSDRRTLSHFERAWLVRRVLSQGGWEWLGRADEPNLPYLLADFIREMKSARVEEGAFKRLTAPGLEAKAADLTRLMRAYDAACREAGLVDPEDAVALYAGELLESGRRVVRQAHHRPAFDFVVFDGFFGFTPVQLLFLEAVARAARAATVTLTLDETRADSGVFHYPLKMRERLLGLGFRERRLNVRRRFRAPGLAALEEGVFGPVSGGSRLAGGLSGVEIFRASSVHQEMEMVAREILERQRSDRFYFSDFMVVLRDVPAYRRAIEETFGAFGIPVEIHERKRLSENPFIRFALDWLAAFPETGFDLRRWHALLRRTYLGLGPSAAALEAVWKEAASPSWEEWKAAADALLEDDSRRQLAELLPWADEMVSLDVGRIRGFWGRFVERWAGAAGNGPEAEEGRFCAEKLVEAVDALRASEDWRERLSGWLERGLYSTPQYGKNRVQVYDVSLALPKEYRVVFASGLAETQFPRTILQDPVLKDAERALLDPDSERLGTVAARTRGERFYFYMAATRARDRLVLTYPASDADGREILPSFFLDEVTRAIGAVPVRARRLLDVLPPLEKAIIRRDVLGTFCSAALRPDQPADRRDAARILAVPELGAEPAALFDDLRREAAENHIKEAGVREEISRLEPVFSASRLGKLANCGYQHFAHYLLNLKESEEPGAPASDGVVLHAALETAYRRLFGRDAPPPDAGTIARALRSGLEESFPLHPVTGERPYRAHLRKASLSGMLDAFAEDDAEMMLKRKGFIPRYFEWPFDDLVLERDGRAFRFGGRIDRIDVSADGRAVIIDYKRGGTLTYEELKSGEIPAVTLYLLAVKRLLGLEPAAVEFIMLARPERRMLFREELGVKGASSRGRMDDGEFGAFLDKSEARLFDHVRRLHEADIRADSLSCAYCGYQGLCRLEEWRMKT